MEQLANLSRQALILWRQVLDGPVYMPIWEARQPAAQELESAGLVQFSFGDPTFRMDLAAAYQALRLTEIERKALTKISEGAIPADELVVLFEQDDKPVTWEILKTMCEKGVVLAEDKFGRTIISLVKL